MNRVCTNDSLNGLVLPLKHIGAYDPTRGELDVVFGKEKGHVTNGAIRLISRNPCLWELPVTSFIRRTFRPTSIWRTDLQL